jgi:hypothetical protein
VHAYRVVTTKELSVSEPKYIDPTVAYNTGYNDGQREENVRLCKEIEQFELQLLHQNRDFTTPQFCGALSKLRRKLSSGGTLETSDDPGINWDRGRL